MINGYGYINEIVVIYGLMWVFLVVIRGIFILINGFWILEGGF